MVEGDIGSPTWKFTQYGLPLTIPLLVLASAKFDPRLSDVCILLSSLIETLLRDILDALGALISVGC
jgi:hypothetical protein